MGATLANQKRSDLQAHGRHPSGYCGFTFSMPEIYSRMQKRDISIMVNNDHKPLVIVPANRITTVLKNPLPHVLFMHIPKTAGTSFNTFATGYFSPENAITHIEHENRYASLKKKYNYIAGHLPMRRLKKFFNLSQFDLYTILREPYSHLHSHLNWVQAILDKPKSGFCLQHHPVVLDMARKIRGINLNKPDAVHAFVQGLSGAELEFFDNCQTRYFLDYHPQKVKSYDLDNARQNLKQFQKIGITEQYRKFTRDFCRQYDAIHCEQTIIHNKAKNKALFDRDDQAIRRALYPLVKIDLQLYRNVCGSQSTN